MAEKHDVRLQEGAQQTLALRASPFQNSLHLRVFEVFGESYMPSPRFSQAIANLGRIYLETTKNLRSFWFNLDEINWSGAIAPR